MKTIDLIRTIEWIEDIIGESTKAYLLSNRIFRESSEGGNRIQVILRITGELAVAKNLIESHPFAERVLVAFGVDRLINQELISQHLSKTLLMEKGPGIPEEIWEINRSWITMIKCAKPWSDLTIPKQVSEEKDYDDILTIQIVRTEDVSSTLNTLQSVVSDINKLYESFSSLKKTQQIPLEIIHISSGSSLRIDMKGLGDAVKQVKNLLVEGWSLWRHRKATELTANSRALLTSLKSFGEIEKLVKSGAMKSADAETLKAKMQKAMLGLFNEGALPREIPTIESVPNHMLIELKSQQLLTTSSDAMDVGNIPFCKSDVEFDEKIKPIKRRATKRSTKLETE